MIAELTFFSSLHPSKRTEGQRFVIESLQYQAVGYPYKTPIDKSERINDAFVQDTCALITGRFEDLEMTETHQASSFRQSTS